MMDDAYNVKQTDLFRVRKAEMHIIHSLLTFLCITL